MRIALEIVIGSWEVLRRLTQRVGPYLLLEAVMPGGTLFALLLYLYRARLPSPAPNIEGESQ